MHKILVSNIGFGNASPDSLVLLQKNSEVLLNENSTRFTENDFLENIGDADVLIAGTEKISAKVIESAHKLRLIARVGVGVDNINLEAAKEKKISICYTPEAPSLSVPEYTLALILNSIKSICLSDRAMHENRWQRFTGRMLSSMKVGVVGVGKIGSSVIRLINNISPDTEILFFDPVIEHIPHSTKSTIKEIFSKCDIITLHIPLTQSTEYIVNKELLNLMKPEAFLINTSRGKIIDENALHEILVQQKIAGAALDVFEEEPYKGKLSNLQNCLLTAHMGSLTKEVRAIMEEQVVEDVQRFFLNEKLLRPFSGFEFYG
jgi:D-3-phosphoglycerate dehydrogenase